VRGLGSIEGLEFQSLRFVFSSEAEEGVEDAFEGLRGARPDAGKGLAMNRQIADQVANRVGAEIDIAQSRIAAHGQRRVACWRKAQAGLVSPVVDERFEMLPAAHALHVFLRGERGMRGKDLEAVELAVLDHQEPSCVAKGIEAANGAWRAFRGWVIHRRPFDKQSSVDPRLWSGSVDSRARRGGRSASPGWCQNGA
jgi:hypothetical protein